MSKKTKRNKPYTVPGHRLMSVKAAPKLWRKAYVFVCECGETSKEALPTMNEARTDQSNHAIRAELGLEDTNE